MKSRSVETVRRALRLSVFDAVFAVQYTTLTAGTILITFLLTLGATEFQVGLVAAFPLLSGLLQPLGAEIIRRNGGWRKPVCIIAALADAALWSVSLSAVIYLPVKAAISVLICILATQYALNAFTSIAWTSWISDLVPAAIRGRYFGKRNFTANCLGAITAVTAGQIIRLTNTNSITLFLTFIGVGILFRLVSIYFLSIQPEFSPSSATGLNFFRQLASPLRNTAFKSFLIYGMAWGFSVHLVAPFFSVYMMREAGLNVSTILLFAGISIVSNLIGQRVWGPFTDRFGDHEIMRITGLTISLQPFWWLFTASHGPGLYLMAVLSMMGGFAWSGNLLASGNLMMRLAPETGKTSFFAIQAAISGLFGASGPIIGGLLANYFMSSDYAFQGTILSGLKSLFFISVVLRLFAWSLLFKVPTGATKPRLNTVYIIRDIIRTFNPTQGFSPLLHIFTGTQTSKQTVHQLPRNDHPAKRFRRNPFRERRSLV